MNTKEYFDLLADKWDSIVHHDPQKVKRIIETAGLKEGDTVLDVGCGTGVLEDYLLKEVGKSGKIIAVDISEKMIEKAKEKFKHASNITFLCADVVSLEFEEYFDVVFCYSVFPHIDDKEKAIKKFAKMLKKTGKLVIAHSQSRQAINELHKKLPEPINSHFLPEMRKIIKWCEASGFQLALNEDNSEIFLLIATVIK
ncbi:class I SAM-dependent methyltransferase [Anaerocellum danielii]|uniref:Class I SAM-dependent methyltransferase n=1 Tax=Anaerocellum danielii TaxID=1387557 RepID=A0ABZ0U2S2_9FIRM|nr:class I SAM-dependent methyltransferase [Caldicellulosiruptor danielii]WPX08535.1 class I SAM-dependent methyltransferase [Caldicellulosiruptor danielii]